MRRGPDTGCTSILPQNPFQIELLLMCIYNIPFKQNQAFLHFQFIFSNTPSNMEKSPKSNLLLKNLSSHRPLKYLYDIQTGKHFLMAQDGSKFQITKNGTYPSKFRQNFTGVVSFKERRIQSIRDKSALHYVPEATFKKQKISQPEQKNKTIQTIKLKKKQNKRKNLRLNLRPKTCENRVSRFNRKSTSLYMMQKDKVNTQKGWSFFDDKMSPKELQNSYFEKSMISMLKTQNSLQSIKRSCYNYKCRQRNRLEDNFLIKKGKQNLGCSNLGKSFFDKQLKRQQKQLKL